MCSKCQLYISYYYCITYYLHTTVPFLPLTRYLLYSPSARLPVTCTSAWNQTSFLPHYYPTIPTIPLPSPTRLPHGEHLPSLITNNFVAMTMVSLTGGHTLPIPPSPMDYAPTASVKQLHGALPSLHHRHMWIITGPAGCGKSTVAQYVAKELSIPYIEGDDVSRATPSDARCHSLT